MVNELSGNVDGPVVQARAVGLVNMPSSTKTVNNVIREARSLNACGTLYRFLVSLVALVAMVGADQRGTPLDGMRIFCDALAIPSGWTQFPASWIAERAGLVGGVTQVLLLAGLLALPRPRQLGQDFGRTLEWRSPSAVVLSLVLMVQSGHVWPAVIAVGSWSALGLWMLCRPERGHSRSDHVSVVLVSLVLAVLYAPLLVCAWLFGRDRRRMPYGHVDAE
ncbi:hypothetical protein ACFWOS_31230 [Streptomyces rubiginosohelvolus]|uniref:hypothetical protein n=1 Tax=Streptomyces rubiginosohelvolus TaxID=67362 RepID=UPI0035D92BF9